MGTYLSTQCAVVGIISELDDGYRTGPSEMFRLMLSMILKVWGHPGFPGTNESHDPAVLAKAYRAVGAYDAAVTALPPFTDILGPVYEGLAAKSKSARQQLGQYFSPQGIALLMAQMTMSAKPKNDGRLHSFSDMQCGSGVMLLAGMQLVLSRDGPAALKGWSITANDIDRICAYMTAVQFIANCCVHQIELGEIIVYRGDSLNLNDPHELIVHATAKGVSVPPASLFQSRP